MDDRIEAVRTAGSLAVASSYRPMSEVRIRPARRLDLVAHFSGAFDLAEEQRPGHAARVAYLAHRVAGALNLAAEPRRHVLAAGLLHDSGIAVRVEGGHTEGGAWVAGRFGFDLCVQEAIMATHERWDGRGRPHGLTGEAIPVEALCVNAAHWACEYADQVEHPLRARAGLLRAETEELEPLVGPIVADALREVLHDDETWLALWDDQLAGVVAQAGSADGKPSKRLAQATALAMGEVIDAAVREPGRAARVGALSRAIAAAHGMPDGVCEAIEIAGYLLDVGQLGVPRHITEKPSILTVDEMELMRRHPGLGARLLETAPGLAEVAGWIEQHHERPDGRGYPEMLTIDELPMPPRILAVADAYWALRAARPYRPAFDHEEALTTLESGAGRQFDAESVYVLPEALGIAERVLAARLRMVS